MRKSSVLLGSVIASALHAQTPVVNSVVNDFSSGGRLCVGCYATIHYTPVNLSFDPTAVVVRVNGKAAFVDPGGDGEMIRGGSFAILLPVDIAAGPATMVMSTAGVTSVPVDVVLDPYAPGLRRFDRQYTCSHTGTAAPGDIVRVIATGLGAFDPAGPTPMSTLNKPTVTLGGQRVEVLESVGAGIGLTIGEYSITFQVPSGDGMHPVTITMGDKVSNSILLPVGKAVAHVSSATFRPGPSAPDGMVSAVGCAVPITPAGSSFSGDARNPPMELGGLAVKVKDSTGAERTAQLLFAGSNQVNYIVPASTSNGHAVVTVQSSDGTVSMGDIEIQSVAPSEFTIGSDIGDVPVAQVVRLRNGIQSVEPLYLPGQNGAVVAPIDMGPESDQVYLVLIGTGIRGRSSLTNVIARIGGVNVPVEYAGAQGEFAGLDQVNLRLPRTLAGAGTVSFELTLDGAPANVTNLAFK